MLSEYAVEPAAIGSDWKIFKDLIDRFGADKGRLISRLPTRWEKKVIEAAKNAGVPDIRIASMVERLRESKHKAVDFLRTYDQSTNWIANALREHAQRPFRAIICGAGSPACIEAMQPDDCSDGHPLFGTAISRDVVKTAEEIAGALHLITAVSREVDIVDPYFDLRPSKGNYLGPLVSLLAKLGASPGQPKAIKIHFRYHESRPPPALLARDSAAQIKGRLPRGYCLELYAWSQMQGGEDFHDRFVLTDLGGVMIGAGLSAAGPAETAAFTLLDVDHVRRLRARYADGSTAYARVGSAVRIRDDGNTDLF
jgi:hypothetical protein